MCHTYTTRLGYIIILNTMDIVSVYVPHIHHTPRIHNHIKYNGYRISYVCNTYTTRLGYIIILNTMDIGSVMCATHTPHA